MQLVNISNQTSNIYLYMRDDKGKLSVKRDTSFKPFYYEKDSKGDYISYDGNRLKKIVANNPYDIRGMATPDAYSSDVRYPIQYLTHKVDKLKVCPVRYTFLDIEIKCDKLPHYNYPKFPVSSITLFDSFEKDVVTFSLLEMTEIEIFENIIKYFKTRKFDIALAWNMSFDYNYLFCRYMSLTNKDFAKEISMIEQYRMPNNKIEREAGIHYPCGTSIIDYMAWFKKVNMRERVYALDNISQKYLKEEAWPKTNFNEINELVVKKNINDVFRMIKLEEKFNIINYFNEIRISTKCLWEDLVFNSRIIDCVMLDEARRRNIVLPNQPPFLKKEEGDSIKGAYRRSEVGFYKNVFKTDIVSSYPNQIITFCLDSSNIVMEPGEDTLLLNGYYFKQDPSALLPSITKYFIEQKDKLKKEIKECKSETEEKTLKIKYDAVKGLVNSVFGATSLTSFRLFDDRVAGTITAMARESVKVVEDGLVKIGKKVVVVDTDSVFYQSDKDEIKHINSLVDNWLKTKYGKKKHSIIFAAEGMFTAILLLGKCNYYAYLKKLDGKVETEIKGVTMKRSSSSRYEASFQETIFKKILAEEPLTKVLDYVELEKKRIKSVSLEEIAFPCKIRADYNYENVPLGQRALDNSRKLDHSFKVPSGDLFYYVFAKPDVLAFTVQDKGFIDRDMLDWDEIIRRNISSKVQSIFESLGYGKFILNCARQEQLF